MLRKHLRLTGSPRAAALLDASTPLPFLRVEPLTLPCTIAETWASVLARFKRPVMPPPLYAVPVFATGAIGPLLKTAALKERDRPSSMQSGLA